VRGEPFSRCGRSRCRSWGLLAIRPPRRPPFARAKFSKALKAVYLDIVFQPRCLGWPSTAFCSRSQFWHRRRGARRAATTGRWRAHPQAAPRANRAAGRATVTAFVRPGSRARRSTRSKRACSNSSRPTRGAAYARPESRSRRRASAVPRPPRRTTKESSTPRAGRLQRSTQVGTTRMRSSWFGSRAHLSKWSRVRRVHTPPRAPAARPPTSARARARERACAGIKYMLTIEVGESSCANDGRQHEVGACPLLADTQTLLLDVEVRGTRARWFTRRAVLGGARAPASRARGAHRSHVASDRRATARAGG